MPIDRFFVDSIFNEIEELELESQEFHHLSHVTRSREGDEVEIVNGKGQLAKAVITKLEKRKAKLKIFELLTSSPASLKKILAQALPRLNRLDTIVEKCTELGMDELWLFPGERSEKKELTESQFARIKSLSISAMKQCGRLYLPKIILHPPLKLWKAFPESCFFGDISPNAPTFFEAWQTMPPVGSLAFFIGPESGFSQLEIEIFQKQKAKGVFLNENILRTDTAAIAALTLAGMIR